MAIANSFRQLQQLQASKSDISPIAALCCNNRQQATGVNNVNSPDAGRQG